MSIRNYLTLMNQEFGGNENALKMFKKPLNEAFQQLLSLLKAVLL